MNNRTATTLNYQRNINETTTERKLTTQYNKGQRSDKTGIVKQKQRNITQHLSNTAATTTNQRKHVAFICDFEIDA